ncbi:hypothetical protein GCM10020254_61320 [Streptomyces goshikiensis]
MCGRAEERGLTVLRGRATEYERHIPFRVFGDAFADLDPELLRGLGAPGAAWAASAGAAADGISANPAVDPTGAGAGGRGRGRSRGRGGSRGRGRRRGRGGGPGCRPWTGSPRTGRPRGCSRRSAGGRGPGC